jgi:hypothetical protein
MQELKDVLAHAVRQSEPADTPDFGGLVARSRGHQRARAVLTASGVATAVTGGALFTASLQAEPSAREQLATTNRDATTAQPEPRQTPELTNPDAPGETSRSTALLDGALSIDSATSCVSIRTPRASSALVLRNKGAHVDYERQVIIQNGEILAADGDTVRVVGGALPDGTATGPCKDTEDTFAGVLEQSKG